MKNWKKIAALLVVLVVFVAAFIFLNSQRGTPPTDTTSPSATASGEEVKLVGIPQDAMAKIILKRPDGEIVLTYEEREIEKLNEKDDGTTEKVKEKVKVWVNPSFDVDSSVVEDIALSGEMATSKRLIDENPQDDTIYGLDKAMITTFVSNEGKQVSIEVGDATPTGDANYVRIVGETKVYTLDSYRSETLQYGKYDIMSKNLYGTEAITPQDITSLALTKGGEKVFEGKRLTDVTDWMVTYPLERKADASDITKPLQWIPAMRASEFLAEGTPDLKAYGLDNPKYVLDYTLAGKTYSLKLGNLEDSKYYAMMEGDTRVFKLDASSMNFLDLPAIDLMDTFVYIPMIYDVEKLVIELDGRVDELLINANQEDKTKEEFHLNGKKIEGDDNASLFKRYYQGAIAIQGDKLDLGAVPTGEAFIKLTYTMKEANPDKVVVVELIPTNDGYGYYLVVNNQYTGMAMGKRQLDKTDMGIRQAYINLMEGLSKTTDSE